MRVSRAFLRQLPRQRLERQIVVVPVKTLQHQDIRLCLGDDGDHRSNLRVLTAGNIAQQQARPLAGQLSIECSDA